MGQPKIGVSGNLAICTFGNAALPNGQGTLSNISLNDAVNWFLQDVQTDDDNRQIQISQLLYRAKGSYVSDDFAGRTISLPMRYVEDATHFLGGALAQLSQAGEQQLSFDGSTYILAKYKGISNRALVRKYSPYLWEFTLDLICRTPWFVDGSATSIASTAVQYAPTGAPTVAAVATLGSFTPGTYTVAYTYVGASGESQAGAQSTGVAIAGAQHIQVSAISGIPSWVTSMKWYLITGAGTLGFTVSTVPSAGTNAQFNILTNGNGTTPPTSTPATSFSVTYPGSVFAEPTFTLTVPSTNGVAVSSALLKNTMSGESLTLLFSSVANLAAATAYTITVDCGVWTVSDGTNSYDISGSFPMLYPPVNQSNAFTIALTPSTVSGVTIAGSFTNRWQI